MREKTEDAIDPAPSAPVKRPRRVLSANKPFGEGEYRLVIGNGGELYWRPSEEEGFVWVKKYGPDCAPESMTIAAFDRVLSGG